jgi:hypothetical protein
VTVLDIVWSLLAIGAAVAVVVLLVPRSDRLVVQPVDLESAVQAAQSAGDVPVVNPVLGEDWQLTSARRERPDGQLPATWHLGWLSPEEEYVGLEATRESTPDWVREVTSDGEETDTLDVAGETWTVYSSPEQGRVSLLLERPDGVLVVTGSAVLDELAEVAEAAVAAGP